MRSIYLIVCIFLSTSILGFSRTVVFYEQNFPSVDNGVISRATLERAFASMNTQFVGLDGLEKDLADSDLLVLPYGSAFPADAWDMVSRHLGSGNLLVLGGRPLYVPVYHDSAGGWWAGQPQNTFSRYLGIMYSHVVTQLENPAHKPWSLRWGDDAPFFSNQLPSITLNPERVFANSGFGQKYRGIGFLVDAHGNRLAAPIVADDRFGHASTPRRGVYLSFDADSTYWNSEAAIDLIHQAGTYASFGGDRLWIDLQSLAVDPGEHVTGTIDVTRNGEPAELMLELLSGSNVLETRKVSCSNSLHEEIGLTTPLNVSGLYEVRAILSVGDTVVDQYTSGVEVRDTSLLHSGHQIEAGRDYFKLDGKPYLPVGINYFSTDPNTSDFFVGGSLGGNAYVWERDFAEMEHEGITIVRTGTWQNRVRYLDQVTGAADEQLLRAIEAYLDAAARHHMQVIFTFFAFNPQVEMQQGPGQEGDLLGPGSNPYLDPVAIDAETAYVCSIVSRFKDVPFLSYDLINEPSFANPKRIWKGNSPNGDPREVAAWHRWIEKRYGTIDSLAKEWHTPPSELGSFNDVPEPTLPDFDLTRYGNPNTVRAIDFDLFAQDAFIRWADTIIQTIRSTGSKQVVTVGQDEGGVTDRVLDQFWSNSEVDYTVNHTWWRDDALLWGSVAAKSTRKPNLIEETGPQPVWDMDGTWRWDDHGGLGLEERKLALAFANGNAGILHWDWTRSDDFGIMRRDGSEKVWMDALNGIASFAKKAQPYATEAGLPQVALVLPQSLQLSPFSSYGLEVQQKAVRALYQYARSTAFAIGEYQLSHMPDAKLIIVPAPWILSQESWNLLMSKVRDGATLLISGRIDVDEHWITVPRRSEELNLKYTSADLTTREVEVKWPEGTAHLSYSTDKTTYAQHGALSNGRTFDDISLGRGHILYFTVPLELSDQLSEIGRIYRYAIRFAGVNSPYETSCEDPGILICPTELPEATLYVLTSESSNTAPFEFHDRLSGKNFQVKLAPGRAALMLIGTDGRLVASYNVK
ncbi:MAG TPA: beta-galactosidase [Candidatus Acidoferrales bacterium]|nr:beta-galactosidase [Candidatus Acidoferrales bacterium]